MSRAFNEFDSFVLSLKAKMLCSKTSTPDLVIMLIY